MLWHLTLEPAEERPSSAAHGRFVAHRHHDADGPHLDLRLEDGDCCLGWRIDGDSLADGALATEKAPHPKSWLDADGDAVREDAGTYEWVERGDSTARLHLHGRNGAYAIRIERAEGLPPRVIRGVAEALRETRRDPEEAAELIRDGASARERAIARLCALGRELDGPAFDAELWRRALRHASLDEIHKHLRPYEARFDAKYPPAPTSQPEALPEITSDGRTGMAMQIARDL